MDCSPNALLWLEIISAQGVNPCAWLPIVGSIPLDEVARMLARDSDRERLSRLLKRCIGAPRPRFVSDQLRRLERSSCGLVCISDEAYPPLLREIDEPPPLLFCAGDVGPLAQPALCIVGARRPTRRGAITARELAQGLSERGAHIVSGLARGIDAAAHEGALEGAGGTSAVLGCGVDLVYPPEHVRLAARIRERGCILSEQPLGAPPLKHHFPLRNRILSGLSLAVVVVEAGERSGALGTASWALAQNREVLAVPGPVDSPMSRGPHELIRSGAALVTSAEQVLAELPAFISFARAERPRPAGPQLSLFDGDERAIIAALDLDPKHIDELMQICHSSPAIILPILLDLEMRGVVVSCGGGTYALAAPAGTTNEDHRDGAGDTIRRAHGEDDDEDGIDRPVQGV